MSNKKQRNTIITDWLEKYGDPEIDKKVEERLEQITKEIMSDKKQSSVEWLISQLQKSKDWQRVLNEVSQMSTARIDIIGKAKAMHKEEMDKVAGDFWNEGASYMYDGKRKYNSFDEYYNETFGGQDNE